MKTVTWNRILKFRPCGQRLEEGEEPEGWLKAIDYWKPKSLEEEVSIPMILESNGLEDSIWALCAFKKDHEREWWLFKADVAELVLHNFEEKYPENKAPREAIEGARLFADGNISKDELDRRAYAAYDAYAYDAYDACAVRAAYAAAECAAADFSAARAYYAAGAAYSAALPEIKEKIETILLKYFGE